METIASFEELIQTMRSELGEQAIAVKELAISFADGEQRQVRSDQATILRNLKTRILWEVKTSGKWS